MPMTFVDHAELIWRRLEGGMTQQALADEYRWSQSAIKNHANLRKVDKNAWQIISTSLSQNGQVRDDGDVLAISTPVPFTENLLRNITDLNPEQQLDLVRNLAKGKNSKGHAFTKQDFKTEAGRAGERLFPKVRKIGRYRNVRGRLGRLASASRPRLPPACRASPAAAGLADCSTAQDR
jgi:hypothetical protein